MNMPERTANLKKALDFIMFKTRLQCLAGLGGGYGFMAYLYGLQKDHYSLYLIHFCLGLALIVAGAASLLFPRPRLASVLGALLIMMGAWIALMSRFGEGAGGSPEIFGAWGFFLAFMGATAFGDYRRFAYLNGQMPGKADVKNAGDIVKKLHSANLKKEQDALTMHINALPPQPQHAASGERNAGTRNMGKWTARLLPDAMVLVQGWSASERALVLCRDDFSVSDASEKSAQSGNSYSIRISGRVYTAVVTQDYAQRLEKWLNAKPALH